MAKQKVTVYNDGVKGEKVSSRWGVLDFDAAGYAQVECEEDDLPVVASVFKIIGEDAAKIDEIANRSTESLKDHLTAARARLQEAEMEVSVLKDENAQLKAALASLKQKLAENAKPATEAKPASPSADAPTSPETPKAKHR